MRVAVVALLVSLTACIDHQLVPCGDLACPIGLVCTPGGCATADAAAACNRVADGTACTTTSVANGTCTGGACFAVACGNGVLDAGEACDDGNVAFNDGCSPDCRSTEVCGNANTDPLRGEECDAGIEGLSSDGCTSVCTFEIEIWREVTPEGITGRHSYGLAYDADRARTVLFGGFDGGQDDETWEYDGESWRRRLTATTPIKRTVPAMAYDRARRRTIMFGGESVFAYKVDDTWEWDGADWTPRTPAVRPPARAGAAMAYDPDRKVVVLFGGRANNNANLNDTWEWDGTTWTEIVSIGMPPSARALSSMTFDPVSGNVVLFGGYSSSGAHADLWAWDGMTWTLATPTGSTPGLRFAAAFASDGGRVVLYGGQTSISTGYLQDTWIWNGSAWSGPLTGPAARSHAQLVYDIARARFVLFGGAGDGVRYDETWELTQTTWTENELVARPGARWDHGLAYDALRGRVVMFGGRTNTSRFDETWEWDGTSWLQRRPPASPPARSHAALIYDGRRVMMFGGAGTLRLNDQWTWDGTEWRDITPPVRPSVRDAHGLAYDRDRRRVVLFGGANDLNALNDTWEYDGDTGTWTQVGIGGPAPSPRRSTTLAYDPHRKRTVLVGGSGSNGQPLSDIWEWDGTTWTEAGTLGPNVPRTRVGLTYDPQRRLVTALGGQTFLMFPLIDPFEWNGTSVDERLPPLAPTQRAGTPLAYDQIHHTVVVLGGADSIGGLDDTWVRRFESAGHPPERCERAADDTDGDGFAGCADPDCYGRCTPLCLPGTTCDPTDPHCGDGVCGPVEDHLLCPADCGAP